MSGGPGFPVATAANGGGLERLEPFFFGEGERRLFGCRHLPPGGSGRRTGAVVCPPMGHEYIRFHRALRQLAQHLAGMAFDVLRFDYSGSGDSSGACEEVTAHAWLEDLAAALEELRGRGRSLETCLLGLRLGGALSALAGARRGDVDTLVLWDPVVNGSAYLEELEGLHRRMLADTHVLPRLDSRGNGRRELIGFALPEPTCRSVEEIDLLRLESPPARRVLLLRSHLGVDQGDLADHLTGLGSEVSLEEHPEPRLWEWVEDFTRVLVPQKLLLRLASWVDEVCP